MNNDMREHKLLLLAATYHQHQTTVIFSGQRGAEELKVAQLFLTSM